MNTLHITGNLTADPEGRTVNTERGPMNVCNFTVAVNRFVKSQKVTDYFRITLWNRQADNAMKYLSKGSKVAVSGPVTARAYMGRDDQPHCSLEMQIVSEIEYLSSRTNGGSAGDGAPGGGDGFTPVDDDELPF